LVLKTALQMTEVLTLFFNCTILIVHHNNGVNCYVKVNDIS
jgi:hypothetical protein